MVILPNRAHLYDAEDTVSACFFFESGIPASGSWCFVGHESAKEDCIEVIGDKGSLSFSVFTYQPIELITSEGRSSITVANPPYVQLPIIRNVDRASAGHQYLYLHQRFCYPGKLGA